MCAADPSLAIYVAELYVLIANRLLVTSASLLRSWLKPLVTLAEQDYETYGASINQYILPKLASVDLSLLSEMIETINESQPNVCISLLFGCYRLALRAGQKGRNRFTFGLPSCYSLLRRILTCHDMQARVDALEFLRTATQGCKDPNELMQLVDIFFSFLRVNLWEPQRSVRQQISYVIYVVTKALLGGFSKAKAKNTLDSTETVATFEPRDRLLPLTALLLQGLYPGVPAARMSLSLSGLYNLVIALNESVGDSHKANDYILGLFGRAARLSLDIGFSDMKDDSCEFALHSTGIKQFSSRLFVGLCSPYEDDREYALQIYLSTGLASKMAPELISRLWRESLTVFATSARPDISPLAWQCIRLAINAVPESSVDEDTSTLKNSKDDPLLQLNLTTPPRERLLLAVDCLLNSVETQLHSAETVPFEGLLAVAASKPFYAMLSAVRSILSNSAAGVTQSCDKSNQGKIIPVRRLGNHRIDRVDVSVDAEQLFGGLSEATSIADRIIGLALRISGLLLPILSNAAPEGHLPGAEDGMGVTFDPIEDLDPDVLSDASETRKFPEYLTVCCWRSVRELSLLLGVCLPQIAGLMPVHTPATSIKSPSASGPKLSDDQILKISQFFCTQLLCGRHRGALEQCSIGFSRFCSSLLR
ncbi:thyroid adenoma-associated protein homolog [Clonorchis sinensis]|uniref:Thyroid adenoma-associated protein homolog n=1 Tax=Clonorchis sinensis TaxID=79923 RepID=G7YGB3_CLOSI|nr:thyroid adenoma-associated protein homolog [Clonorchis sinensis]